MKAVIDTNVLISALLIQSSVPARVIAAWRTGRFDLVISRPLLEEFEDALRKPKIATVLAPVPDAVERLLFGLRRAALLVDVELGPAVVAVDPNDDYVLYTALAGQADYIITGDRALLALGEFRATETRVISIVTPSRFLGLLAVEGAQSS